MYTVPKKMMKFVAAVSCCFLAHSVVAQDALFTVEDTNAQIGGQSNVRWNFTQNDPPSVCGLDVCMFIPDTAVDSVDLTNCFADVEAPHAGSAFSECAIRTDGACFANPGVPAVPADTTVVRVALIDFGQVIANEGITEDAAGLIGIEVNAGFAAGATFEIPAYAVDNAYAECGVTTVAGNTQDGTITGVEVSAVLNVDPGAIDFGTQQQNTTSGAETVTVTNDGTDSIDLEITSITPSGEFAVAGGDCMVGTTLSDGETCTVDVEFSPTGIGAFAGDLVIGSDAGAATNDTVALTGEGTTGPVAAFTIDPNVAAFGTVDLGDMPQSIVHTIENTGDAGSTLDLNNLAYTGDAEFSVTDNTCPASLGATESCTVTVTFDAAANGNYTGDVDVSTNIDDFNVPVSGEAASVAVLSINPPFGPVDLGVGLAGETITANGAITNDGSAPGDFSCVLGGADAGVFSTNPSPLSGVVPAGDDVGFSLSCNLPTSSMDGDTFNATLTCTSDDDDTFGGVHLLSCGTQNIPMIPVPTMQPWALVLFSMLMLIAGGIGIRFFRAS